LQQARGQHDFASQEVIIAHFLFVIVSIDSLGGNVDNAIQATLIEAFGTAFLCFIIFTATNPKAAVPQGAVPVFVGVAIGLMVTLLGPLTG
jgi:glycerol uptake facilitator-like aquaporin